jgi:transposase
VYEQDNAAIHTSRVTKQWFQDEGIEVLDWPACSPDPNPIENLWGIIVRQVYAQNRQFDSTSDLKKAIQETWDSIDQETLRNLVESMQNRIYQVINRSGGMTDY